MQNYQKNKIPKLLEFPQDLQNDQKTKKSENSKKYKICAGCESIVAQKVNICPNCHAYRFIDNENLVIAQAQQLGKREAKSVLSGDFE